MKKITRLWLWILMVATAANGWAGMDAFSRKNLSPTEEVVTPHIKWTKPDAQGPLKVLFIINRSRMREVVELAQRMELQYTVFVCDPDRDHSAIVDDFMAKFKAPCDVIVLGNVDWSSFPLIIQAHLLKKVKDGTPLIGYVTNPNDNFKRATAKKEKLELPALVPYKGLPAFAKHKDAAEWLNVTVDCAAFGKGKILTLKGFGVPALQALTPGPTGNILEPKFVEYDYYLAWIGHLMRFAAGRTTVRVTGDDYVTVDRANPSNVEYSVSGPEGKAVTCAFTFRNDDNQVIGNQEKEIKLSTAGTAVSFDLSRAPAGRYFADIWVKESGKVWAYGSSFMELSGNFRIESIEMKPDYRREEKVNGKVKVAARKAVAGKTAPAKSGMNLVLRQRDTHGRVTAESRMDIPAFQTNAAQEVSFEFSGSQPRTIVQYLEVELRQGDEILDRKEKSFSISNLPSDDDIRFIGWCGGINSYPGYYMFAELAKAGFDAQYTAFSEIPCLYNIRHISYATRLIDQRTDWYPHPAIPSRTKDDHVRLPCLLDPEYRQKLAGDLTKRAEQARPFSASEFSMGDECHFVAGTYELCFCTNCVSAFHAFLKNEYRTVEEMNREYEGKYGAFEEVQPVTLDDAGKDARLVPLWVDFRRHMENTWAGIFPYCTEVIRKIIPEAKIGYEGSDTESDSYRAADFYKLMKTMQMNGTYDGAFVPYAVVNFAQPGTLLGLGWFGGYGHCQEFQPYIVWRHLFRGANSYWIWHADPRESGSVMAPDLSLHDYFKGGAAEVREIKRGIGKLLMTSKRVDDGIAILYSASSVHVATLTKGLPSMEKVLNALIPLFEDTGHQFGIISYEQLAQGELKKGGYKVLWMPYVQALSRNEAAEVEKFTREGGTVIADLRPGMRDEHGKPHEEGGILDKVFGVNQRTEAPIATNCEAMINLEGYAKTLKNMTCDWSVRLGTGEAKASLGQGPALINFEKRALIVNQHGKGKTILLNFSLSAYAGVAGSLENSAVKAGDEAGDIRELFKAVMTQAGVEEPVKVEPEIEGVRLYRFAKDGLVYLGVLQELPEPVKAYESGEAKPLTAKPVILKIKEKRHVYDSRLGKYLGYADRIKTMIEPAKGMLFALLPYEVKGVRLSVAGHVKQGGILEYEAAVEGAKQPGLHVFHVELVSPKGEIVPYYAENVAGENGKCKGSVPLALNEAVGKWKIRVRDVATGMTAEQAFAIEERKQKTQ